MKFFRVGAVALVMCGALALTGCVEETTTYVPEANEQAVSDSALVTAGTLTIGVDTSEGMAPLSGVSSSNKVVGMDVDFATWLADEMGLSITVIDVSDDPIGALESGLIDVLLGYSTDDIEDDGTEDDSAEDDSTEDESAESESTEGESDEGDSTEDESTEADSTEDSSASTLWYSDPYIYTASALFSLSADAEIPADDAVPQISAEAARQSAILVTNEYGADSLVSCNDMNEVFELLSEGSVEYAAADALIGSYAAYALSLDAHIIALLENPSGYCAVIAGDNTELQEAFAAALSKVTSNGIYDEMIEMKWLGKTYSLDGIAYSPLAQQYADTEAEAEDTEGEDENAEAA